MYTTEEKLAIYTVVREELAEVIMECNGFCVLMRKAIGKVFGFKYYTCEEYDFYKETHRKFDSDDSIEESPFPELIIHHPKELVFSTGESNGLFWFSTYGEGIQKRLQIIDIIINELKTIKNN